ncbi:MULTISPECIES: DUF192 domain-containing protein [Haloarcula]|uniref:DUF192 domain-containing protein n=1 Tax=Haloarcula TaxID=2237 RepID=UPI0023EC1B6B|nr:DUF192 domain-containing protein [Halomicroarcula sp. XH51]
MERRALAVVVAAAVALVLAAVVLQSGLWVSLLGVGEYEEGTVTVREGTDAAGDAPTRTATATPEPAGTTVAVRNDSTGPVLATVEVRIADTFQQRYVGLSETPSMGPDEGMLFVHDDEGRHAYVMRNMSFELDIVFVAADGTITTIHHASLPPEGTSNSDLERYEGRGLYVLEVNRGWANRTGVGVGDRVELPDAVR